MNTLPRKNFQSCSCVKRPTTLINICFDKMTIKRTISVHGLSISLFIDANEKLASSSSLQKQLNKSEVDDNPCLED